MSKLQQYLSKNSFRGKLIQKQVEVELGLIVVIPVHDEEELITSVTSLQNCIAVECAVEVIVIFNAPENSVSGVINKNKTASIQLQDWYSKLKNPKFQLFCIEENELPKKHAGVGLARKIGMDEAVRRFESVGNEDGVIVCFDADSKCETDYLVEIEKHFKQNTKTSACSIHFEHPTNGEEFAPEVYRGIYYYELHLRYYKNGIAYANLPYAFHTIGSSMAVRVNAYCEQGGMNRRKAGEDFYFLQKFIDVGSLSELQSTTVIPSPRFSHRVPFGTGRAIQEMIDNKREIEKSYAFESFEILKACFANVAHRFENDIEVHPYLLNFLSSKVWESKLAEIRRQSVSKERFEKRFFQWFNAFQVLKFVHFLRDHYFQNEALSSEVPKLLNGFGIKVDRDLLEQLRKLDAN